MIWHRGVEMMLEVVVHVRPEKLDQWMRHDRPRVGPFTTFGDVVMLGYATKDGSCVQTGDHGRDHEEQIAPPSQSKRKRPMEKSRAGKLQGNSPPYFGGHFLLQTINVHANLRERRNQEVRPAGNAANHAVKKLILGILGSMCVAMVIEMKTPVSLGGDSRKCQRKPRKKIVDAPVP